MRLKQSEHDIQAAFITYVRMYEERIPEWKGIYAIPNGMHLPKKTNKKGQTFTRMSYYKAEGFVPGVLDICVPFANQFYSALYIEFKAGRNKMTAEQEAMAQVLKDNGNQVILSRSSDHAIYWLLNYTGKLYLKKKEQENSYPKYEHKRNKELFKFFEDEQMRIARSGLNPFLEG